MHFSMKCFLTAKLHIVLVFQEQNVIYILNFGLAPFIKTILWIEIKKSPCPTTIFDERLNKKLQRGQMDILIRFWEEDKKVDTRYFDSLFLDGATATNIQEAFMSGIKELDKNDFLQIS